ILTRRRMRASCTTNVVGLLDATVCTLNEGEGDAGDTGNASDDGSSTTTMRIGTTTDVENFNPLQSLSKTDSWILNAMYPSLLRIVGNAEKVPELAEEVTTEDGGNTVVFHLNDGFEWSDGTPVTANDVKFTADSIMEYQLGNVAAKLTWVEDIEVRDDQTVAFHLNEPYAPFAEGVGFWMRIVPEH